MSIEQAMHAELSAISMSLRDHRYMDPPDGGDVSLAEQVARMRRECDAYRKALEEIAGENKQYLGHGDFDIHDNCSDKWARDLARSVIGHYPWREETTQ